MFKQNNSELSLTLKACF